MRVCVDHWMYVCVDIGMCLCVDVWIYVSVWTAVETVLHSVWPLSVGCCGDSLTLGLAAECGLLTALA
jgi:hypothetical protein